MVISIKQSGHGEDKDIKKMKVGYNELMIHVILVHIQMT